MTGSLISPELRHRVRGLATPLAVGLGRLGLTPNGLTLIGFVGTCVAAVAAGAQAWVAAGVLLVVFGLFDLLDGALARATGRTSNLGAFLDSTFDRWGEAIVYIGIAWGCVAAVFTQGAILAAAAMASAFMVSYVRAKAESLAFSPGSGLAAVGLAPREVRITILGIGLIAAGLAGVGPVPSPICFQNSCVTWFGDFPATSGAPILGSTLGLITILATITTIQRILHVRAQSREG